LSKSNDRNDQYGQNAMLILLTRFSWQYFIADKMIRAMEAMGSALNGYTEKIALYKSVNCL